jgi:sulfide:quinone oxidoreductase
VRLHVPPTERAFPLAAGAATTYSLERIAATSLAFVVPPGVTWPPPLYELALMLAERALAMGSRLELHLVTPEASPLEVFGIDATREVSMLLAEARLEGPAMRGLPSDAEGFLVTDIAARAGAAVEATPFTPVLRAILLTERWTRFLRCDATDDATVAERALWWPPATTPRS